MDHAELADTLLDAIDEAKAIPKRHLKQGSGSMLLDFRNDLARWKTDTKTLIRERLGRQAALEFEAVGDPEVAGPTWPFLQDVIAKYETYLASVAERIRSSAPGDRADTAFGTPGDAPIPAFCSYASKDDVFREELEVAAAMLERQRLLKIWHFRKLEPGVEWDAEIRRQLAASTVILLLISPDFLNSRYTWNEEVSHALQRHDDGSARVVPIILRPSDWKHAPLNKLQALPKDGVPITQWTDRDAAWQNVTDGLRRVIAALRATPSKYSTR